MSNLARFLAETARRQAEATVLHFGSTAISYAELEERSARTASFLRAQGLCTGDRVALMLPNVPEFVTLFYGILRAGGIVVPLNPLLRARETSYHLADSGAKFLFEWHGAPGEGKQGAAEAGARTITVEPQDFAERLGEHEPLTGIAQVSDDDIAVLIYTSGTTGRPKGAALTHGSIAHNTRTTATTVQQVTPEDVMVGCLPLFHIFGQTCTMHVAIHSGASLALVPRFDPQTVLDTIGALGATIFQGVPTMYAALLHHPAAKDAKVTTLRMCVSGGASLPVEILHDFEQTFDCRILEGFGMSETSPVVTFNHADRPRKPGSIGTPIADVAVRVVDDQGQDVPDGEVGELAVQGPNVMKGYWQRPEETRAAIPDGWLLTGDLARKDEDGYFFIVDRKKDLIIRGGYNIYPREIEEVLHEHAAVAQAAVVGIPDTYFGEEVGAAVVLRAGAETTPEEIQAFVKERVAPYKYPRRVWLTDALPIGPSGKIIKRSIAIPGPDVAD